MLFMGSACPILLARAGEVKDQPGSYLTAPGTIGAPVEACSGESSERARAANTASNMAIVSFPVLVLYLEQ